MDKKVKLKILVPPEHAERLAIIFQKLAYKADPKNKIIMEVILNNRTKTAEEIRWILRNKHKMNRMAYTIINMAKKIGIEIKK